MTRPSASLLTRLAGDLGEATGTNAEVLAAPGSGGLGAALLPVIALVAALIAAVAVGTLVVAWLRKPEPGSAIAVTEPMTAGLLAVGFVSGTASARWLPATVMQLAGDGVIAIQDRREVGDGSDGDGSDAGGGAGGRVARGIRLVFASHDPLAVRAGAESSELESGTVLALLTPGLDGGPNDLGHGSNVDIDRVVTGNERLAAVTRGGFRDAAELYREPRPRVRFALAAVGGALGVALGFLSMYFPGEPSESIAWNAIVIGALSLGLRVLLPRWIPLNAAGMMLRERASRFRADVASTDFDSVVAGERLLPWAVLLDEPTVIRRFAEVAERTAVIPAWYRSMAPFTADRLVSCIAAVTSELSQPIRVGGRASGKEDSRFGVPLVGDHGAWGGGYLAGGAEGAGGGAGGDFGGGFGDGGGGGFGGGGFGDGGGGGGGDGGGG